MATAKEIFIEKYAGGFYGDNLSLKKRLEEILGVMYDAAPSLIPADDSVTLAKMAHMATASVLGRIAGGEGAPEVLTAANIRTIIGLVTAITGASTDAQLPSAKLLYDQLLLKQQRSTVEIVVDNRVLTAADHGMVFGCGTDNKTFTLPATAQGLMYTFVNTGANGNNKVTVSPNAADKIMGSFCNKGANIITTGTNDKDIVNTLATSKRGDHITLVGDGVDGWYILEGNGIWTEESQLYVGRLDEVSIKIDNYTVVAADSGKIFGCGTKAKTFSLPATVAGLKYTFVNTGAAGFNPLNISPVAADGISGTFTLAASVVVGAGVVNKDIINTEATSQCGDSVTIIGTGVAGVSAWVVIASTGIWAAEL